MKTKFILWIFAVLVVITSMFYTPKPTYAWSASGLYARIAVPGGGSARDDLMTYITGKVDKYSTFNGTIEITINGKLYITHTSNVLLYEK